MHAQNTGQSIQSQPTGPLMQQQTDPFYAQRGPQGAGPMPYVQQPAQSAYEQTAYEQTPYDRGWGADQGYDAGFEYQQGYEQGADQLAAYGQEQDPYAQQYADMGGNTFLDPAQYDKELNEALGEGAAQLEPPFDTTQGAGFVPEGDFQNEFLPESAYQGEFLPESAYQGEFLPESAYQNEYTAEGEYQGDYAQGEFVPESEYQEDYAQGDYQGGFASDTKYEGEFAPGDYQGEYVPEGEFQSGYAEGEYQGDYVEGEYQGEYAQEGAYQGEYDHQGEFVPDGEYQGEYAQQGEYQGDYAHEGEFVPEGEYQGTQEGDYQGDYAEGDHQGQFAPEGEYQGDYAEGEYQGEYAPEAEYQGNYAEGEYQGEYVPEGEYQSNYVAEAEYQGDYAQEPGDLVAEGGYQGGYAEGDQGDYAGEMAPGGEHQDDAQDETAPDADYHGDYVQDAAYAPVPYEQGEYVAEPQEKGFTKDGYATEPVDGADYAVQDAKPAGDVGDAPPVGSEAVSAGAPLQLEATEKPEHSAPGGRGPPRASAAPRPSNVQNRPPPPQPQCQEPPALTTSSSSPRAPPRQQPTRALPPGQPPAPKTAPSRPSQGPPGPPRAAAQAAQRGSGMPSEPSPSMHVQQPPNETAIGTPREPPRGKRTERLDARGRKLGPPEAEPRPSEAPAQLEPAAAVTEPQQPRESLALPSKPQAPTRSGPPGAPGGPPRGPAGRVCGSAPVRENATAGKPAAETRGPRAGPPPKAEPQFTKPPQAAKPPRVPPTTKPTPTPRGPPVVRPAPAPQPEVPAPVDQDDDAWGWGEDDMEPLQEQVTAAGPNEPPAHEAPAATEDWDRVDEAWGVEPDAYAPEHDVYAPGHDAYPTEQDAYAHDAYATQDESFQQDAYEPKAAYEAPSSRATAAATRHTHDPLIERRNATVPIGTFGIGGRLVVHLPRTEVQGDALGYDAPRQQRTVTLRRLASIVGTRSFATLDLDKFPGPLLENGRSGSKQKKAAVVAYLHEQIAEAASGVGYLRRKSVMVADHGAAPDGVEEWRRMEDKILLLKLLVLLVENDGHLLDDANVAAAVAELLQGKADETFSAYNVPTYSRASAQSARRRPLRTYTLRQAFLEELQLLLQQGALQQAVDFAVREHQWAHAMTIAQRLDAETRERIVREFMHYELDGTDSSEDAMRKDWTSIKVAYGLYTQQTPEQIAQLFRSTAQSELSAEARHAQWRQSVATLVSNRSTNNADRVVLSAIGDGLLASGLLEAAHVCYLLAGQHEAWVRSREASFVLIGAAPDTSVSALLNDLDPLLMTEVLEFAYSLASKAHDYVGIPAYAPYKLALSAVFDDLGDSARAKKYCDALVRVSSGKGAAPYTPGLLAELQLLASRLHGSELHTGNSRKRPTLDGMWGALEGRLSKFIAGEEDAAPSSNAATDQQPQGPFAHYAAITPEVMSVSTSELGDGSERGRDETHPSALEGDGYTAGNDTYGGADGMQDAYTADNYAQAYEEHNQTVVAHGEPYDAHAVKTGVPEGEYPEGQYDQGQYAEGEYDPGQYAEGEYDQGQYAEGEYDPGQYAEGEYGQDQYAEGEHDQDQYAEGEHDQDQYAEGEYDQDQYDQGQYGEGQYDQGQHAENLIESDAQNGNTTPADEASVPRSNTHENADAADEPQETTGAVDKPPAPPVFHHVESDVNEDGLLSTMPAPTLDSSVPAPKHESADDNAGDDLGLGNSRLKKATEKPEEKPAEKPTEKSAEKPVENKGSSWLGRLLGGRSGEKEGKAKKAHLGEETSFYYDKELKRWVNKKAGDDGKAAPPPLPPPPKNPKPKTDAAPPSPSKTGKTPPSPSKGSSAPLASGKAGSAPPAPGKRNDGAPPAPGDAPTAKGSRGTGAGKKRPLKSRYIVVD